jgi:hypothetical protein
MGCQNLIRVTGPSSLSFPASREQTDLTLAQRKSIAAMLKTISKQLKEEVQ